LSVNLIEFSWGGSVEVERVVRAAEMMDISKLGVSALSKLNPTPEASYDVINIGTVPTSVRKPFGFFGRTC